MAILGGCQLFSGGNQPLPTATLLPTPQVITAQVSTGASAWRSQLHDCTANLPEIGLVVDDVPTGAIDLAEADLAIRIGEPETMGGPAYPVGSTRLRAIVNPQNPVDELTPDVLSAIFRGEISDWSQLDGFPVEPLSLQAWTYLSGEDVRLAFEKALLPGAAGLNRARLAPSPQAMREAVAADPGAIGYLPEEWLDDTVKAVELDSGLQTQLTFPVLALTPAEPEGLTRKLLGCLQR